MSAADQARRDAVAACRRAATAPLGPGQRAVVRTTPCASRTPPPMPTIATAAPRGRARGLLAAHGLGAPRRTRYGRASRAPPLPRALGPPAITLVLLAHRPATMRWWPMAMATMRRAARVDSTAQAYAATNITVERLARARRPREPAAAERTAVPRVADLLCSTVLVDLLPALQRMIARERGGDRGHRQHLERRRGTAAARARRQHLDPGRRKYISGHSELMQGIVVDNPRWPQAAERARGAA